MADQNQACENCGHQELQAFIDKPNHQLLHCPECNLFQKGVLESELIYEEDYHEDYARRLNSKMRTAKIRLGSIRPHLQTQTPRMLDIGCSVGATLSAAKELGWNASGVDVSQKAIDICHKRGLDGQVITDGSLPFEDNTFDVVTNWHVIEHVLDVRQTLAEWKRVLKSGGVMILETPDANYLKARILGPRYKKFWPSEHLYTFNQSNLTSIMKDCGFEILPTRLIGGWKALPIHLTAYAIGYRSLRTCQRSLSLCKSIEVCCRKPVEAKMLTGAA